jgi:Putative peptidoglycan binding domain
MKRTVLIGIGSLALALTASAEMSYKQRKAPQTPTTYSAHRGPSAVRQMPSQRTFSNVRSRPSAASSARFREPAFRQTRIQPRTNISFMNRPTVRSTAVPRTTRPAISNYSAGSRLSPRLRGTSPFVNRPSEINDVLARRQTRLAGANDLRESRLRERPRSTSAFTSRSDVGDIAARRQVRPASESNWTQSRLSGQAHTNNSLLKPFTMNDTAALHPRRAEFNDRFATTYFKGQTRSSFVNRSGATTAAIQGQRRAAFSNNWRGDRFAGRQYWAFRNYQSQWHDSGWWNHHCDRIVFVTVYSEPFPFYFDAGYWYPAWGYYADAYYPYDGPIYCYNDLPPDEIITNVQIQLYNDGYYDGPIDGILGPDTRAAIADYQADYGLAVTAAIDEPTVESLGLV